VLLHCGTTYTVLKYSDDSHVLSDVGTRNAEDAPAPDGLSSHELQYIAEIFRRDLAGFIRLCSSYIRDGDVQSLFCQSPPHHASWFSSICRGIQLLFKVFKDGKIFCTFISFVRIPSEALKDGASF